MIDDLAAAEREAVSRFKEIASLSRSRLEAVKSEQAASDKTASEQLSRVTWISCMLLNTSEEAMRAKHALMCARGQQASDQLQTAQQAEAMSVAEAEQV